MIEFTLQNVSAGLLSIGAVAEYWRTRRGPLVLLAVAVTHARAFCVCLRWLIRRAPGDWRAAYPQAVQFVKEQG